MITANKLAVSLMWGIGITICQADYYSQYYCNSEGCPRQIVAYSDLVFGFQCYMELTTEVVTLLIANDDLTNAHNYRFVEQPEKLLSHDYSEMNNKLYTFLDKLAVHYLSK
ncbi:hypothetical protein [Pseudoalteromonas tetraodonis]|uniref:hypothetical protein n=1 Tax=Pseudoalteromonas tetraodonis TaxID=43659 RepID=UPI003A981E81